MLTESEIKKIEERTSLRGRDVPSLLATVKEQRELLAAAQEYVRHQATCPANSKWGCDCHLNEMRAAIEQALK
jgi:hypothetical protein